MELMKFYLRYLFWAQIVSGRKSKTAVNPPCFLVCKLGTGFRKLKKKFKRYIKEEFAFANERERERERERKREREREER